MSGDHEHRGRFRFYPYQADKADKAGILEKTTHARERIASPHDTHDMPDMQVSGRGYASGDGVRECVGEAVKWMRKAARNGYAPAQYNLGVCYEAGWGVKKNMKKAVELYRKAAAQGEDRAMQALEGLGEQE